MATTYRSTELIGFLHGLSRQALPETVVAKSRQCLLDAFGCSLFGSLQPWSRMLVEEMIAERSAGDCVVIGHDARLAAPAAALCNGLSIHGYELDDLIASSIIHPAAAVIPAALAAADAQGASGERVLLGIVAGYDAMHRLAAAMGVTPSRQGFHVTSLAAPVGAAVAAAKVMELDLAQTTSAIGIACSTASGIKAFATGNGGGMVKRLHLGRGAEAGVRAVQLAKRGFSGPPFAIDGKFGLLELFGRETAAPECLTEALGSVWAIEDIWFKVYPICGWIQSVVQALSDIRQDRRLAAADIASVRVGVSSYAAANNGDPAPIDTMGAQYSIPFCAAISLLGNPRDPAEYGEARLRDSEMREVQSRVSTHVSDTAEAVYPDKFAADVELVLSDGQVTRRSVTECRGTPADPCSDSELEQKFLILAGKVLPEADARQLARLVAGFDEQSDVRELASLVGKSRPGN